ncbi:MAG: LysR family transcriptional regulator [Pseudomonadota bacterium]
MSGPQRASYTCVVNHWTQLRTALLVARFGTVSAAAEALGVHRATVNRHIDTLEAALGATLFQRHARGYTPTDAGRDMLDIAGQAEKMFSDLEGRSRSRAGQLSGNLVVATLSENVPLIVPALDMFRRKHPEISLNVIGSAKRVRLEHGEAHVALRNGERPKEDDYVVLPFGRIRFGMFAHRSYVDRHGAPESIADLARHCCIALQDDDMAGSQCGRWLSDRLPEQGVQIRTNQHRHVAEFVMAGIGIGILANDEAKHYHDLVPVLPEHEPWVTNIWIVTHVDLHRTPKVQAFLSCLKDRSVAFDKAAE